MPVALGADQPADLRLHLVRAATALFIEHGYDNVSVPGIARAAGLSRDALYGCFSGKLHVFEVVVANEFTAVRNAVMSAANSAQTPLDMIVEGGDAFLRLYADSKRRRMMFDDAPRVLGVRYVIKLDIETTSAVLRTGIQAAKSAGQLPATLDVDAIASLMAGAYDRAVIDGANGDARRSDQAREAIRMIWAGLSKLA